MVCGVLLALAGACKAASTVNCDTLLNDFFAALLLH